MKTFCYVLTAIGSVVGGFFLFLALTAAESAPQEASLAAIAVAFAVIPYCFARAVDRGDSTEMAADLRAIADHYRRIEQQAANARIQETRRQTAAPNPYHSPAHPSP